MATYNVSRETFELLSRFINILTDWQTKMNLVSNNSLDEIWTRHVADSLQLYQYLNTDTKFVYDIGSGAGFPAIVLAAVSKAEGRSIQFKLIESIAKKTVYLNAVKNNLGLENVEVINARSESLKLTPANIVTARAVASLDKLFSYTVPLIDKHSTLLFPKGKTYQTEIDEALKHWDFYVKVLKNEVEPEGVILKIRNLRKKR